VSSKQLFPDSLRLFVYFRSVSFTDLKEMSYFLKYFDDFKKNGLKFSGQTSVTIVILSMYFNETEM
jgi:hypothetical protein